MSWQAKRRAPNTSAANPWPPRPSIAATIADQLPPDVTRATSTGGTSTKKPYAAASITSAALVGYLDAGGKFVNLGGGFMRTVSVFTAVADALRASGRAPPPAPEQIGDGTVWTFEQTAFPAQGQVRVRVGASGYVHAGITHADGRWDPVYEVPLIPRPEGGFEAALPPDVGAFTFFWTQAPATPGHPGHWEREERGGRVFQSST
jgi:hypothetical protein